jgi:hypothetical protein
MGVSLYKLAMFDIVALFSDGSEIIEIKNIYTKCGKYSKRTINLALKTLKQHLVLESHNAERTWQIDISMLV